METYQITNQEDIEKVLDGIRIGMEVGLKFNKRIIVQQVDKGQPVEVEGVGQIGYFQDTEYTVKVFGA